MLVLDTNVVVAALRSQAGASFWLVRAAIEGRIQIAISVALALEYEAVVKRSDVVSISGLTAGQMDQVLDAILASATLTSPIHFSLRPAAKDPGDDMVLECAVAAGATAIVTLNRGDLEVAAARHGIRLLTPGEAVEAERRKGQMK